MKPDMSHHSDLNPESEPTNVSMTQNNMTTANIITTSRDRCRYC